MRKSLAILLILALVLPVAALADTPYANDAMGLTLSVPDGWAVTEMEGGAMIMNAASMSIVVLLAQAIPNVKLALPVMNQEIFNQLIAQVMPIEGMDVVSFINHSDSDTPVIGLGFTGAVESVNMTGLMCLYAPDDATLAIAMMVMPPDNPPDISWFVDPLEAMFPALADM
ncbi:MAG: hypothetical protein FWF86_01840 [Clostridia bacterium]|nr:hypothetical protein [Clostridia bacterium]